MFNAFQWNCFNLVDTSNIALILFSKCDVTKCRIPPLLVTECHTLSTTPPSLTCDVIYGCPLMTNYIIQATLLNAITQASMLAPYQYNPYHQKITITTVNFTGIISIENGIHFTRRLLLKEGKSINTFV